MVFNNTGITYDVIETSKSITTDLNIITQRFIVYLSLVFSIFGFIGFIGNLFTYLQRDLRSNTCCIYSLCGSIIDIINLLLNLLPSYLGAKYGITIPWYRSNISCKINLFLLVFLPHLSTNFLLMAIIDRFACTCSLTSPIRRLNQLKMVPLMIASTIVTSCLASLYTPIMYQLMFGFWCISTDAITTSVLYIVLIGLMQPIAMLIFVFLTYRNVRLSRQRVGLTNLQQSRTPFVIMVFAQIFTTAFISLQWIIMFLYYTVTLNSRKSADQYSIILFVYSLTNYCYYLNNVKAFYVSLLTSHLFRETFIKGLRGLLPRYLRQRIEMTATIIRYC